MDYDPIISSLIWVQFESSYLKNINSIIWTMLVDNYIKILSLIYKTLYHATLIVFDDWGWIYESC